MTSDASSPKRPPRRSAAPPPYTLPYRIMWWLGALLPTITVALDLAGLVRMNAYPLLTPVNTLFVSVIICSAASYSQRRDVGAMLTDFALVLLVSLAQVTLIGALAYWLSPSSALPR